MPDIECMDLTTKHLGETPADERCAGRGGSALRLISMGSVALLVPLTADAADFLREEVASEPWQWQTMGGGDALAVEPDCAEAILEAWEAR